MTLLAGLAREPKKRERDGLTDGERNFERFAER
jgi:hypothetical protein